MKKASSLFIILLIVFSACKKNTTTLLPVGGYDTKYAKGFTVDRYQDYTLIKVTDPWDTLKILQTYILVDREKKVPENLPSGTVVKIPVQSAVAYSTIHCSSLNEIGALDIIKGVCESEYVGIDEIQRRIKNKTIIDVGQGANPDIEKILMLEPEVIFTTPLSGQSYGQIEKTKIPLIETPDYMETEPLGRAEWIRFYSLFVGKESFADSIFNITVTNYNNIKNIVSQATFKPSVFTDTRYQSNWNTPGGKSFLSNMLVDAGANYIWKDNESTSFMPLPFEEVLDKAGDADFWLIKYYSEKGDMTYESLKKEYMPYSYFKAYKEQKIYGCNTAVKNYYEDLPIHPEYILRDFAYIFHPDLFPDYEPQYYTKID